ncbi:MAG: MmcQ/YjbR family DNA-binding protein [Alphaproteobacteria bacterium]|nr:MmcQ/YjbR family DNA-binding protein [Alphaproteobacteria bacterium]
MSYTAIERHCLSLPGTSVHTPWGESRVFKVGGKMFAMITMENGRGTGIWFKAGEQSFRILTAIDGIRPCPYLARAHWVAMDGLKALKPAELKAYLTRAHAQVAANLPKKTRASLGIAATTSSGTEWDFGQ